MKLQGVQENGCLVGYAIRCPGCQHPHVFYTDRPTRPKWSFDGNLEKPTFSPSMLVWWQQAGDKGKYTCHSFVTDGRIQFLDDCTHALKGQTVELPEFSW